MSILLVYRSLLFFPSSPIQLFQPSVTHHKKSSLNCLSYRFRECTESMLPSRFNSRRVRVCKLHIKQPPVLSPTQPLCSALLGRHQQLRSGEIVAHVLTPKACCFCPHGERAKIQEIKFTSTALRCNTPHMHS